MILSCFILLFVWLATAQQAPNMCQDKLNGICVPGEVPCCVSSWSCKRHTTGFCLANITIEFRCVDLSNEGTTAPSTSGGTVISSTGAQTTNQLPTTTGTGVQTTTFSGSQTTTSNSGATTTTTTTTTTTSNSQTTSNSGASTTASSQTTTSTNFGASTTTSTTSTTTTTSGSQTTTNSGATTSSTITSAPEGTTTRTTSNSGQTTTSSQNTGVTSTTTTNTNSTTAPSNICRTLSVGVGTNGDFAFSPSTFTVRYGDQINFIWGLGIHKVASVESASSCEVSNPVLFSSPSVFPPFTYNVKINNTFNPGIVNFACLVHCLGGMRGSFTVLNELCVPA